MIDFLAMALAIFAVIAGSAVGWAVIAALVRSTVGVAVDIARDRLFLGGAGITAAILCWLIIT